jgi:hypothetical protein
MAHTITLSLAERYGDGENKKVTCRPQHPRDALEVIIKLLDALDDLHKRGLVYCDVQPEKVMVTTTNLAEKWRADNPNWMDECTYPPTDMGQRLEVSLASPQDTCQPIPSLGRPRCWEYSAPEQWNPEPNWRESPWGDSVGSTTDVFGAAGVLFYLLSGHAPLFLEAPPGKSYSDLEPDYRDLALEIGESGDRVFNKCVSGKAPAWAGIDHDLWHDSLNGSGLLPPGVTGGLRHVFFMTLGQKKDTRIDVKTMKTWLEAILKKTSRR